MTSHREDEAYSKNGGRLAKVVSRYVGQDRHLLSCFVWWLYEEGISSDMEDAEDA